MPPLKSGRRNPATCLSFPDYNRRVGKKNLHSQPDANDRAIADVLAQVITAVQSQKIPAKEAMKIAMATIGASQKAALGLLLYATELQAEMVRELLAEGGDKSRSPVSQAGDLLLGAAARSFEVFGSFAAGLTGLLTTPAAPVKSPPESPAGVSDSVTEPPPPEAQPLTESQLLESVIRAVANGYSAGLPGGAVAESIRERYPAAIPVMQRYLSMDDFLVLMWMRQQPALAELAADKEFPRFYAELKAGILSLCTSS
jgi:hypothetical protein